MGIHRPLLSDLLKYRVCGFYLHLIFAASIFGSRFSRDKCFFHVPVDIINIGILHLNLILWWC